MSPIAPGRMRSRRQATRSPAPLPSMADTDWQSYVDGFGRKAHAIVARLIAKFPRDVDQSGWNGRRDLKTSEQLEVSGEHRQRPIEEVDFAVLRLGINDFGDRDRSGIPGEAQRDQVRIRRLD